jgi:hypothetical protein
VENEYWELVEGNRVMKDSVYLGMNIPLKTQRTLTQELFFPLPSVIKFSLFVIHIRSAINHNSYPLNDGGEKVIAGVHNSFAY